MHLCCRLTTKQQHGKGNQVKPVYCFKLWMAKTGPRSKTLGAGGQDALLAFYMLNSKMLSSGEAGNEVRGTGQRLGANHHA